MPVVETSCVGQTALPNEIRQAPISFLLVVLCTISFVLFYPLKQIALLEWFNFVPVNVTPRGARYGELGNDWWRFVTPVFLHFSWMHLVFNCLWLWEFGKRIEIPLGSLNLTGLFLVSAIASNGVQYLWVGPSIFGGMSGVVYALLGFLWSANRLRPDWLAPLPPALFGFLLVWLLIGVSGALEFLGVGAVANGAHVGGLVLGMIAGALMALLTRTARK